MPQVLQFYMLSRSLILKAAQTRSFEWINDVKCRNCLKNACHGQKRREDVMKFLKNPLSAFPIVSLSILECDIIKAIVQYLLYWMVVIVAIIVEYRIDTISRERQRQRILFVHHWASSWMLLQLLFTYVNRQTVAAASTSACYTCWYYGCRSIISTILFPLWFFFASFSFFARRRFHCWATAQFFSLSIKDDGVFFLPAIPFLNPNLLIKKRVREWKSNISKS